MTERSPRRGVLVAELVATSAWLGAAALFVTVVAPAAFSALPNRTLAGALVGAVLPALFYTGIVLGAGLLIAAMVANRERVVTPRTVGGFLVAVSCLAAQFVVAPRIERARAAINGPVEALGPSDGRRVRFGRLHAASVLWLGLAIAGAVTVTGGAAASLRRIE